MKVFIHLTTLILLALNLSSCAKGFVPDSSTFNSGDAVNITNTILTSRSEHCEDYVNSYAALARDLFRDLNFVSSFQITDAGTKCDFTTNSIPNHNFHDNGNFNTFVAAVPNSYSVTKTPTDAAMPTPISLNYDNAIFLNGVKLDVLAAACYGVGPDMLGQERRGCNDMQTPWRYDPMFGSSSFGTDSHNAHTQPDGTYHYHGNPMALFNSDVESPVIGFAADGYPIFGPYINDGGTLREVVPGYTLKTGARANQLGEGAFPGGNYDGTYRDDYEFTSAGDLDECNGMTRNGVYGYYISNAFPWAINCFKGTPDSSFMK